MDDQKELKALNWFL